MGMLWWMGKVELSRVAKYMIGQKKDRVCL